MEKLTKSQVVSKIKKEGKWTGWVVPSKSYPNPGHPFNLAVKKTFYAYDIVDTKDFEKFLNEFSYYNCNAEVGKNIHFYMEGK